MLNSMAPRGFDRRVWIIFSGNLLNAFGMSMVWIFLTVYLNIRLGISMTFIGTMFMASTWFSIFAQIFGGSFCDAIGRRKVMLIGLFFQGITFLLLGMTTSKGPLFALFIFQGMVGSLFRPAAQAMIADIVKEEKRVEAYGLLRVGANAGYGMGAMIGGFLAAFAYRNLFFFAATTNFVYLVLAIIFLSETLPQSNTHEIEINFSKKLFGYFSEYRKILLDIVMVVFCIAATLNTFVYSQTTTTFSVYSMKSIGISTQQLGMMWALNAWMVVILQMPVASLVKKIKITHVLMLGSVFYAVAFLLLPFSASYLHLLVFMLILTTGELVISPVIITFVANIAPPDMRGRYMAFSNITFSLGHSIGPFAGGRMMDKFDTKYLWYMVSFVAVISTTLFLKLEGTIKKDKIRNKILLEKE
ncbi:MAG: MDR family MFS transporter [Candidatus Methanofastidiosia archaeon]